MKLIFSLYFAALSLLQICDANSPKCANTPSYLYRSEAKKTCKWITKNADRRQKLCLESAVASSCPISCGHCCIDNQNFRIKLKSGKKEKCNWLDTNAKRRNWCKKEQMIRINCRKSCKTCLGKVTSTRPDPPTNAPTKKSKCADNLSYVYDADDSHTCKWISKDKHRDRLCLEKQVILACPISCGYCCENNLDYRIVASSGSKKCSWLVNNEKRKSEWCEQSSNGQQVKRGCPRVCGACFSKVTHMPSAVPSLATGSPSARPTTSSSNSPTKNPSISPSYITTHKLTKKLTWRPVRVPSSKPVRAPSPPTGKPHVPPTNKPVRPPTRRPRPVS